ncbi:MAG: TrkH family potassium uptake protein [Paracoccus sp. (in: a-proteobacteria)]|nr:TrkH family potassium uptake protein [Paracoccus sp. (in: a-proteobacteria)]
MIDLRPVAHITGRVLAVAGVSMLFPAWVDWADGNPNWQAFAVSALITASLGVMVAMAAAGPRAAPDIRQSFVLTSTLWAVLPAMGTMPLMMGAPGAGLTDAMFETMSGVTTTGATAFAALDPLPRGVHLWRAMLQWMGGLGIVVVAMVFLPLMRVGGMQFFRSEGFDTMGKVLPRAGQIAADMTWCYVGITFLCMVLYGMAGMSGFDALIHALTTCSTGGFSNYDTSFAGFTPAAQWVAVLFMVLATLPFVRLVQAGLGDIRPLLRDSQIRAYLRIIAVAVALVLIYRVIRAPLPEAGGVIRETVFNIVTVISGTGFAYGDVTLWGPMGFVVLILIGLIGGCTGSTVCSIKVFRYQVLFKAVTAQIRRMQSPHRVYALRMQGKRLDQDVIGSVMSFFTLFILSFGLLIIALSLTGLHPRTALTAAWTSIANVGPVWGPEVTSNGSVAAFPASAKWLMIAGMYLGRLELISVFVLFLPRFWRD